MPHFIIEYSTNIDESLPVSTLANAVFDGAIASGLFNEQDIKVRAYPCAFVRTGSAHTHFVHVTGRILPGRTKEQKYQLSKIIMNEVAPLADSLTMVTTEVLDMDRNSYLKMI